MTSHHTDRVKLLQNHLTGKFSFTSEETGLQEYRKRGLDLEPTEILSVLKTNHWNLLNKIIEYIENSPHFDLQAEIDLTREQHREVVMRRIIDVITQFPLTHEQDLKDPIIKLIITEALGRFCMATSTRWIVHSILYLDTIFFLGTEKHRHFIDRGYKLADYGSYCMTELGHGSNVALVETTATYDHSTRQFVINSPTPTAAKWWVGALANTANMTILFA